MDGIEVLSVGAFAFGAVIGYVTYRTLVRKEDAGISDIASVVGAVGGAAVTGLFSAGSDAFGWYAIGLAVGFALFLILRLILERDGTTILGD